MKCNNCGIMIDRYPSQVKATNYCSQACSVAYRNKTGFYKRENHPQWEGGPVSRTCVYCGVAFSVRKSRVARGEGNYCSKACCDNARSVDKTCEICGKSFRLKLSHDVNGNGKYCSIKCRSVGYERREYFKGVSNPHYIDGQSQSKEYVCRHSQKRRTKLAGNGGDYTLQAWADLCVKFGNRCLCCGKMLALTVDHVIPVIKGGSNNIGNLQPLCKSCNSKKNAKVIDYREVVPQEPAYYFQEAVFTA